MKYYLNDGILGVTNPDKFLPHLSSGCHKDWRIDRGHCNLFQNCAVNGNCDSESVLNDDRRSGEHTGPSTNINAIHLVFNRNWNKHESKHGPNSRIATAAINDQKILVIQYYKIIAVERILCMSLFKFCLFLLLSLFFILICPDLDVQRLGGCQHFDNAHGEWFRWMHSTIKKLNTYFVFCWLIIELLC